MNLTDAGLPTSTEYSCHPSHGLDLLSSSGTPLGLVFQGFIYNKPVLLASQKLATLGYDGESGWRRLGQKDEQRGWTSGTKCLGLLTGEVSTRP